MVTAISAPFRPTPDTSVSRLSTLYTYFNALFAAHGPQHWWPGRTRFEIIVGAILTQSTSWKNVESAIANLRAAKLLSPAAIRAVSSVTLAKHLRPSGYFRQKTKTLTSFVTFLYENHFGSLNHLFATPIAVLRIQLLSIRGIGPETADSIVLYAGKHPVFVVDAYSRRILERHNLLPAEVQTNSRRSYEQIRSLFESHLPRDPKLFNEFHALIVQTGKLHCRKSKPLCSSCPLYPFLPASHQTSTTRPSPVASPQSHITLP